MHTNSNFKLYTEIIRYAKYVRRYVAANIPAVHRDIKIHLLDEIYNLKRFLIEAQYTKGNIRIKNITEMIVSISMIDILTDELLELCSNNKKNIVKSIEILTSIKNMTFAWRNNPEPNEKKQNS